MVLYQRVVILHVALKVVIPIFFLAEIDSVVTADSKRNVNQWPQGEYYWPEYFVSKWFREKRKEEVPVFMFERLENKMYFGSLIDWLFYEELVLNLFENLINHSSMI